MSNTSFIPSATASTSTQDFLQPLSEKNSFQTGANNFDQYLKNANENQFETRQSQDKPESFRPAENEAKQPEPDRYKSISQSQSGREESKPAQETVADGEKKDSSQLQASNTVDQESETEGQNEESQQVETPVIAANQEELLALIANLAEVEAVIKGETQPGAIQMAELTEAMANSELTEAIQGTTVEGVQTIDGLETPVIKEILTERALTVDNPKALTEGKTADLGQINQVLQQASGKPLQSEGDSFFNQEQNSDAKGLITGQVKISQNTNPAIEDQSQAVNKMASEVNSITQKVNAQAESGEDLVANGQNTVKDRVLAHGQTAVKDGKVDLAMIQTHLAVNDAPKVKTETPVLNIISSQPSINNTSQLQTSGSSGVNPTNREELFSQIVESAKVMVSNGGSEMEVNLKPEHLGKLQLKVTIENEVVTAKFVAESQQVKEIIESNLGQLKRNLQESGMQVDTIMVSVGNHQGGQSFEQAAHNQDGSGHFKGSSGTDGEDLDFASEDSTPLAQTDALIDLIA